MTYVTVKEDTEETLHLAREPSVRAWAIAVAMMAIGLGAAYYSVDDLLWKVVYVSGAVFIGLSWMEDWEDCILDKSTGLVTLKKQSLVQRLLAATRGRRMVVAQLDDVCRVSVQEDEVAHGMMGYVVVLHFTQGYDLGVTESVTSGDREEHERVAAKVRRFLALPDTAASTPISEVGPFDDSCSTTSDDSFEKIDTADIASANEDIARQAATLAPPEGAAVKAEEAEEKKEKKKKAGGNDDDVTDDDVPNDVPEDDVNKSEDSDVKKDGDQAAAPNA